MGFLQPTLAPSLDQVLEIMIRSLHDQEDVLNFGWLHFTFRCEEIEQMRRKTLEMRSLDHLPQSLHNPDLPVYFYAVVLMLRELADQFDRDDLVRPQALGLADLAEAAPTQLFQDLIIVVNCCHPNVR
jgi:hypothetical protein